FQLKESMIGLASQSAHLFLSLEQSGWSMSLSDDRRSLDFSLETDDQRLSRVDLKLIKEDDATVISQVVIPSYPGVPRPIRIDGFYSVVFGSEEEPILMCSKTNWWIQESANVYRMEIRLYFDDDSSPHSLTPIVSSSLDVGSTRIGVSKELLGIQSNYFCNLFYGDFAEKKKDKYELKKVDEKACLNFIKSIHERTWAYSSVDDAMIALELADGFEMTLINNRMLPYLKTCSISKEGVRELLVLVGRSPINKEFARLIVDACRSTSECVSLVNECSSDLPMATSLLVLSEAHRKAIEERDESEIAIQNSLRDRERKAPVTLRCLEEDGTMMRKKILCLYWLRKEHDLGYPQPIVEEGFHWPDLWEHVPSGFNTVRIEGHDYTRDVYQDPLLLCYPDADSIVQADAYRS
ncbi:hypothetical protein PFISCL1PPCAC_24398, partial [Pristionchus fissidentatus]